MPTTVNEIVTAAARKPRSLSSRAHARRRRVELGLAVEQRVSSVCQPVRTGGGRVSRLGRSGVPRYACESYRAIAREVGVSPASLDAVRRADANVSSRTRILVYRWLAAAGVNPFE